MRVLCFEYNKLEDKFKTRRSIKSNPNENENSYFLFLTWFQVNGLLIQIPSKVNLFSFGHTHQKALDPV
jgi:hypothetical protein